MICSLLKKDYLPFFTKMILKIDNIEIFRHKSKFIYIRNNLIWTGMEDLL